jgi:hypothetical protein
LLAHVLCDRRKIRRGQLPKTGIEAFTQALERRIAQPVTR